MSEIMQKANDTANVVQTDRERMWDCIETGSLVVFVC